MRPIKPSLSPAKAAKLLASQRKSMKSADDVMPEPKVYWTQYGPLWSRGKLKDAQEAKVPQIAPKKSDPVITTIRDLPTVSLPPLNLNGISETFSTHKYLVVLSLIVAFLLIAYKK